nr:ABC transporter permease [uncultured Carboxylicivirga sp.]
MLKAISKYKKGFLRLKVNLLIAFDSMKQHPTRNVLTGLGVAWGVLVLILLVAAGQGLQEGVMRLFGNYAQNSLWYYGGYTETGNGNRKPVVFQYDLLNDLRILFPEISALTVEKSRMGENVVSDHHSGRFSITACDIDYFSIKLLKLDQGRFFNPVDEYSGRQIAVIGERVAEELFNSESAIGHFIQINGSWFKVVGQLKKGSFFDQSEQNKIFIPFGSYCQSVDPDHSFSEMGLVVQDNADVNGIEKAIGQYLGRRYGFDPQVKKSLYVFNRKEQVKSFKALFGGIQLFLWIVGLSMLLTGMIGISNTLFMVVKERTKEIGIRKSVGAKSRQILSMILVESVSITLLSGLVGLFFGGVISFVVNWVLTPSGEDDVRIIEGLSLNITIALITICVLVITGSLAGLFPARKAANISPVEAINYETN